MTSSDAVSEGTKSEEEVVISEPEPESNPVAAADPPETQTLTPATTE
jgi:hypothetical protein